MRWTDDGPTEALTAEAAAAVVRQRQLRVAVLTVVTGALLLALAVVVGRPDGSGHRAAAATSAPASTSSSPLSPVAPATTVPRPDPVHVAELRQVAAGLPAVSLTSPALWDQWLPDGKPYPGADVADDLSTCPVLSARLGAALGTPFSYWQGTLPAGPYGCYYAPTPLQYETVSYPYLVSVGWLADGPTEVRRTSFLHHEGQPCPSLDVPSAGDGAVLVRCEPAGGLEYVLTVRDARGLGLWVLSATARAGEARTAPEVLGALIDGAVANYG